MSKPTEMDVTRDRTRLEWLRIADQWHWQAVELRCDIDPARRRKNASDIAALTALADYCLRRAQLATDPEGPSR